MPELTQRMIDAGATGFSGDIPIGPDGTPVLPEHQPPSDIPKGDTTAPILAAMQAQIAAQNAAFEASNLPPDPNQRDPLGYGFGPFYGASPQDYPENRTPLEPPQWNLGMEGTPPPGALISDGGGVPIGWEQYHTPNDRSSGGGFFTAEDQFPGEVPFAFQQGMTSPSTNNWRLLPGQYRSPQFIMRNGRIIDRNATDMRGPPVPDIGFGNNYGGPLWNLGVGAAFGVPAGRSAGYTQSFGWPGQLSNWLSGTYWAG